MKEEIEYSTYVVMVDKQIVHLLLASHVRKMYSSSFANAVSHWFSIIDSSPGYLVSMACVEICNNGSIVRIDPQIVCAAI